MIGNGFRFGAAKKAIFLNETKVVPGGGFEPPTRGFSVGEFPVSFQRIRSKMIGNRAIESIRQFGAVATVQTNPLPDLSRLTIQPDRREQPGEVYFIRAIGTGLVKIGMARCSRRRFAGMGPQCPVPLVLVGVIHSERAWHTERDLHIRFAALRSHGEWFRESDELNAFIAESAQEPKTPKRLSLLELRLKNAVRRRKRVLAKSRMNQNGG